MLLQPTEADARELLVSSGIRYKDRGEYFLMSCPFHADKHPSAVLYKDKWIFKCFSCGETRGFAKFYEDLKHKPWNEHGDFSLKIYHCEFESLTDKQRETYEIIEGKVTSVYDNAKALEYCRSRNIDDKFMQFFEFQATDLCKFKPRLDRDGKPLRSALWKDRLLIPINLSGGPYSLEGRDYTRRQFPKCLYPKGCKTDICFNQDNLNKDGLLIVCEGLMDIHKIWTDVTKNVTCTFGAFLTDGQKKFLRTCRDVILFIDSDKAGFQSADNFDTFYPYDFKVAHVQNKDPGASDIYEIMFALENAEIYPLWLIENQLCMFPESNPFSIKPI